MRGLVDSHCHLDAAEFDADREAVLAAAQQAGVAAMVLPAVERANFGAVLELCERHVCCLPALGIHPMYVERATPEDLDFLRQQIEATRPAAIGEIGLDFFIENADRKRQEFFFVEQLKLAREFDLPVLLHILRAQDEVLKHLRHIKVRSGIAHAFNGSRQQADMFIGLGFRLGFGGAMTYPRASRIRDLASTLPIGSIVLETDAPDMPPEWLGRSARNSPAQLPRIAQVLAELRGEDVGAVVDATSRNMLELMPDLGRLCTLIQVER